MDSSWPTFGQNNQRNGQAKPQPTYALVTGAGDTDNAAFTIDGNELKLTAPADFEAKPSYSIRIEGTDPGGLKFAKALTISVTDVNDAPTDLALDTATIAEKIHRQRLGPRMSRAWQEMDQVTIAAIEGHCIGGGAALVVSLDFRFCGKGAHFRIPEIELGMNMSWGSIPRMIALMGPARTKQAVILSSDRIPAAEALEWGLVEKVVDDGQALTAAMEFAERIAKQPPIPVRMTKTTVNRFAFALHDLGSHMDAEQNVLTGLTEDYKEGTSAFREKRKPVFKGR